MHTWFHAQLDQKIFNGLYFAALFKELPYSSQSSQTENFQGAFVLQC